MPSFAEIGEAFAREDFVSGRIDLAEFERRVDELLANEDDASYVPRWVVGGIPVFSSGEMETVLR